MTHSRTREEQRYKIVVLAFILIILPFVIIFPIGYYYNGLPYTDDGYCDLGGHAPAVCIVTQSDGVSHPVHEFCTVDEYIYVFSVKLLIDLGFLNLNLTVPNDILIHTRYLQVSVFSIYYLGVAFPILFVIHRKQSGRSKTSRRVSPPQPPEPSLPLPPPPEREGEVVRNATIGACLLVLSLFIFVLPIIPVPYQYQEEQTKTLTLFDEFSSVSVRNYIIYNAYIDLEDPKYLGSRIVVRGEATETSGRDINFYVFDEENYNLWKEGYYVSTYVSRVEIKSDYYYFTPDHSGTYTFVFDNLYSSYAKSIHLTASIDVSEWVTITETRYESLLNILLSWQGKVP